MERLSDAAINIINDLHKERLDYTSEYLPLIDALITFLGVSMVLKGTWNTVDSISYNSIIKFLSGTFVIIWGEIAIIYGLYGFMLYLLK